MILFYIIANVKSMAKTINMRKLKLELICCQRSSLRNQTDELVQKARVNIKQEKSYC